MADELEPTPAPGGPEEPAPEPPDEETPRGRRRRRWRRSVEETVLRGSLLGAGVLLVLALLAIVSYLGWKYHWRWDWTETRIYSLSETTENVLEELDEDVRVTVFITPGSRL